MRLDILFLIKQIKNSKLINLQVNLPLLMHRRYIVLSRVESRVWRVDQWRRVTCFLKTETSGIRLLSVRLAIRLSMECMS